MEEVHVFFHTSNWTILKLLNLYFWEYIFFIFFCLCCLCWNYSAIFLKESKTGYWGLPYLAASGYRFQDRAQEMPLGVLGYRQYVTNLKLEFERHLYTGKRSHKSHQLGTIGRMEILEVKEGLTIEQVRMEEGVWLDLAQGWNQSQILNSGLDILIILVIMISKIKDWIFNSNTRVKNITGNSEILLL